MAADTQPRIYYSRYPGSITVNQVQANLLPNTEYEFRFVLRNNNQSPNTVRAYFGNSSLEKI